MATLAQTRYMMTGNTHPRLVLEDVAALVVPVPSADQQLTIAAEVDRRCAEARRLGEGAAGIRGCAAGAGGMNKLRHLIGEVEAAFGIHLAGPSTEQFNRAVFVLVDDAVELAAKLHPIERDPAQSDAKP